MCHIIYPPPMFNCQVFNYTFGYISFYTFVIWRFIWPFNSFYFIQLVGFIFIPRKANKRTVFRIDV